jgi:hypothetical protein
MLRVALRSFSTKHTANAGSLAEALKIVTPLEQEKFKLLKSVNLFKLLYIYILARRG